MNHFERFDDAGVETRAAHGDPVAQTRLGVLFARGQGRPRDFREAIRWWKLAAAQGHADAMCNLGNMHDVEPDYPRDDAEAARWYRLAAERG